MALSLLTAASGVVWSPSNASAMSQATSSSSVPLPSMCPPLPTSPPRTCFVQPWAFTSYSGSHPASDSDAQRIAQNFNVINADTGVFTPAQVSEMRGWNPNLVILQYENASFSSVPPPPTSTQFQPGDYLYDVNGNPVKSVKAPGLGNGNFLMNPLGPTWMTSVGNACMADRATNDYNGCYFGMLSTAMFATGYLTASPINTTTGKPWTRAEWVTTLASDVSTLRLANSAPVPIVGNTPLGGSAYWAGGTYPNPGPNSPRPIVDTLDGGHAEGFLHSGQQAASGFPSTAVWQQNVQMLVDAGIRHDVILTTTKVWTTTDQTVLDSWHAYSLATFLMGTDGTSYYEFSPSSNLAGMSYATAWDSVDIGLPLSTASTACPSTFSACQRSGGAYYERDFSNGIVVVNPSLNSATVKPADPTMCYTDLQGTKHLAGSSFQLASHTGNVLLQTPC